MNVRLTAGSIRCRVTRAELDLLLSGRAIVLEVSLPRDHKLRVNVRPSALGGWQLDSDPTGVWLSIPRADLDSLAQSLPSKEGIAQTFPVAAGMLAVSFEVDLHEQ